MISDGLFRFEICRTSDPRFRPVKQLWAREKSALYVSVSRVRGNGILLGGSPVMMPSSEDESSEIRKIDLRFATIVASPRVL
jgi:hypothetical protein